MILRTEWSDARRQYEATLSGLPARMAAIAFDDFERLCGSPEVSDVAWLLDDFVAALRSEGVDPVSLNIFREAVEGVVAWAMNRLRVAA